jgi:hypothetical protein
MNLPPEVTNALGGEAILVPVKSLPWAKPLECFWNVRQAVAEFGGEAVYGWQVLSMGHYYQCEHHAVWKRPDGTLVDPTPNEDAGSPHAIFIEKQDMAFKGWQTPTRRVPVSGGLTVRTFCSVSDIADRLRVSVQREPRLGLGKIHYDLYRLPDADRALYWACHNKRMELHPHVFPPTGGER